MSPDEPVVSAIAGECDPRIDRLCTSAAKRGQVAWLKRRRS